MFSSSSIMGNVLFDVSGLVQWYAYLRNPSGIQRVMENILGQSVLAEQPEVTFVARALGSEAFYEVEPQLVSGLLSADTRHQSIAGLRGLFAASMRLARPARLLREMRSIHLPYIGLGLSLTEPIYESYYSGRWQLMRRSVKVIDATDRYDALVGLGDFWCHGGHVEALIDLKRRTGARLIHLVHDLVAVVHPQWTHPHYGQQFVDQLGWLAPHVDHWLSTSNYVANQLSDYLQRQDLPARPIDTIPMGWPNASSSVGDAADIAILHKYGLQRGRYMLHVGTVEPRKNLGALFDALASLPSVDRGGLPCVLVGRDGWRSETVRERLKADGQLSARIKWIKDAPDAELSALYRFARFTVVPSFDEGWGLAVQESLAHGTPCIASPVGGIPEAGRGLATYVAKGDGRALAEAIQRFSTDNQAVDAARAVIARLGAREALPSWVDSAETIRRVASTPMP